MLPETSQTGDATADATSAPAAGDALASVVGQLARLQRADTGALARLRRFAPGTEAARSALFETESVLQQAGIDARGERRERWALVLHCLALVRGRHVRGEMYEAGAVLARLRVSEARMRQLVEADYDLLSALLPRLARRVAAAAAVLDWRPLADLALWTGVDDPAGEARANTARRLIVGQYLKAQRGTTSPSTPAEER